jgi:ribosomal-protein-alanine N-acetyltransferase
MLNLIMIQLSMPARIETERLLLQRLRYEDAEEIFYAYASKPEATRYLAWPTHNSVDDTRRFINYAVDSWEGGTDYSYSIRLRNGVLIGGIGVVHENGKIQLGYVISPAHWNNGYTTEACSSVLSVLKQRKELYRIGTFVDTENTASIRVLKKCGMVEEAVLPRWFRFVNQNNRPKDCVLLRLVP